MSIIPAPAPESTPIILQMAPRLERPSWIVDVDLTDWMVVAPKFLLSTRIRESGPIRAADRKTKNGPLKTKSCSPGVLPYRIAPGYKRSGDAAATSPWVALPFDLDGVGKEIDDVAGIIETAFGGIRRMAWTTYSCTHDGYTCARVLLFLSRETSMAEIADLFWWGRKQLLGAGLPEASVKAHEPAIDSRSCDGRLFYLPSIPTPMVPGTDKWGGVRPRGSWGDADDVPLEVDAILPLGRALRVTEEPAHLIKWPGVPVPTTPSKSLPKTSKSSRGTSKGILSKDHVSSEAVIPSGFHSGLSIADVATDIKDGQIRIACPHAGRVHTSDQGGGTAILTVEDGSPVHLNCFACSTCYVYSSGTGVPTSGVEVRTSPTTTPKIEAIVGDVLDGLDLSVVFTLSALVTPDPVGHAQMYARHLGLLRENDIGRAKHDSDDRPESVLSTLDRGRDQTTEDKPPILTSEDLDTVMEAQPPREASGCDRVTVHTVRKDSPNQIISITPSCWTYQCPACAPQRVELLRGSARVAMGPLLMGWAGETVTLPLVADGGAKKALQRWQAGDPDHRHWMGYAIDPDRMSILVTWSPPSLGLGTRPVDHSPDPGLRQHLKKHGSKVKGVDLGLVLEDLGEEINLEAWRHRGRALILRGSPTAKTRIAALHAATMGKKRLPQKQADPVLTFDDEVLEDIAADPVPVSPSAEIITLTTYQTGPVVRGLIEKVSGRSMVQVSGSTWELPQVSGEPSLWDYFLGLRKSGDLVALSEIRASERALNIPETGFVEFLMAA